MLWMRAMSHVVDAIHRWWRIFIRQQGDKMITLTEDLYNNGRKAYDRIVGFKESKKKIEDKANYLIASNSDNKAALFNLFMKNDFILWLGVRNYAWASHYQSLLDDESTIQHVYYCIMNANAGKIEDTIKELKTIFGEKYVCISAMLSLLKPDYYGIVNRHVIMALQKLIIKQMVHEECDRAIIKCDKIDAKNLLIAEKYIRDLADDNVKSARDIDKALWGLGHIWKRV